MILFLSPMYSKWIQFFTEFAELKDFLAKRCIKPVHASGKPDIVIFSDASSDPYGAVAYARWHISDGKFKSCLIASKNWIAPVNSANIVRLEFAGAVLATRLRVMIHKETRCEFNQKYHIVDSEIIKAMVNKSTFAANRVGEIRETTQPEEWVWMARKNNIAGWITRGESPREIGIDSES